LQVIFSNESTIAVLDDRVQTVCRNLVRNVCQNVWKNSQISCQYHFLGLISIH